jgi:hypothetical protein
VTEEQHAGVVVVGDAVGLRRSDGCWLTACLTDLLFFCLIKHE